MDHLVDHLIFEMKDQLYGVSLSHTREVLVLKNIEPFPQAPPFIAGIIPLRGHSILAIDLNRRFEAPEKLDEKRDQSRHVIVAVFEGLVLGFLVDHVKDVISISQSQMDRSEDFSDSLLGDPAISAIAHVGERNILILDLKKVFKKEEHHTLEKLKEAA